MHGTYEHQVAFILSEMMCSTFRLQPLFLCILTFLVAHNTFWAICITAIRGPAASGQLLQGEDTSPAVGAQNSPKGAAEDCIFSFWYVHL